MRKGQVSLELLLLLSVMVCVLYISLSLLSRTYSLGTSAISSASAESLSREIATVANEICAMGEGNSRIINTNSEFSLSYGEGKLALTSGEKEFSQSVRCPIDALDSPLHGDILLENAGSAVTVRNFSPE